MFGEIAQRAGISVRTVRRLLTGPLRDTRPTIVRRAGQVRALAEQMGYRPNAAARAVATGRFHAATLLMTTATGRSRSSFELLRSLQAALAAQNMHLNVAWLPDEQLVEEESLPKVFREWMCDGLLINYTHGIPSRMAEIIERNALPSVWLNCTRKHDSVRPDDVKAGRLATEPLLERGCRRIAFLELGRNEHDSVAARRRGYQQALAAAGRAPEFVDLPLPGNALSGTEGGTRAAILRQWLAANPPPDGVVTYSAWTAEPLLYAASSAGLDVPRDLAVTTIEDEPATHLGRPVTTVVLDFASLSLSAVDILRRKIDAPEQECPSVRVPPHLVAGDTV
jgi:DNA-binding LacI/PurR family transcriptional regulator